MYNYKKKLILSCLFFVALVFSQALQKPTRAQNIHPRAELEKIIFSFPLTHAVHRCKKEYGYTDEDMVMLEKELKRYFLMILLNPDKEAFLGMYSEHVDNLWHAFILFTKEYHKFGYQSAGKYLHHEPNLDQDRKKSPEETLALQKNFRDFILCYEKTFQEPINSIWLLDGLHRPAKCDLFI